MSKIVGELLWIHDSPKLATVGKPNLRRGMKLTLVVMDAEIRSGVCSSSLADGLAPKTDATKAGDVHPAIVAIVLLR